MSHGMYEIISRKRDGGELSTAEIATAVDGYVGGSIPDYQMAALLMAIYLRGLADRELGDLTRLMRDSGDTLPLPGMPFPVIDKHSTGGVGDKVTFVVAPLVAACGVGVAMLSGRGLGHTGGTLDKMESIAGARVFLEPDEFRRVLKETGMVIAGQTDRLVPADKKIYALRDATATVSSIPLIASSIMSKKLALGADGVVMDIKTGSGAFMRDLDDALRLGKKMADIGAEVGRPVVGLLTDMDQPLGLAVGNSLEMIESIECLKGRGPADLMEVTLALGVEMLRMAGRETDSAKARERLLATIADGSALVVFRRFVAAVGGDERVCDDYGRFPQATLTLPVSAPRAGVIARIDALEVGMAAIDTGAGRRRKEDTVDPSAGFLLKVKVGDRVEAGAPLATVLGCLPRERLEAAAQRLLAAIVIADSPRPARPLISHRITSAGIEPF